MIGVPVNPIRRRVGKCVHQVGVQGRGLRAMGLIDQDQDVARLVDCLEALVQPQAFAVTVARVSVLLDHGHE